MSNTIARTYRIAIVANWDWVLYNFRLPLVRSLSQQGLNIILVCPKGDYYEKMEALGFNLIPWNLNRRSTNPISEILSFLSLLKIYRSNSFDAVHHFTIKPIVYGSIAARISGILHIINNFTGLGYLFSKSFRARFLRALLMPIYKLALHSKKVHTIFQNPDVREELSRRKILIRENTSIVPGTGIELNKFSTRKVRSNSNKPIILMAARLLFDKGVSEYIEAANLLAKQNVAAIFQLAGNPDFGNPAAIPLKKIEEWKTQNQVIFLGHRDDIPSLLNKSDIAVLPSYHEGVPLFLLEAAASSLPIVATDIEGCRMVVQDQENGYLVPVRDSKKLAEAILKLINKPDIRKRMGKRSRQIIEERFDSKYINQKYIALYEKLGILDSNNLQSP